MGQKHERDGSRSIFTGATWRGCTCGAEFVGTAEASFTERDAHIATANVQERIGSDRVHVVVVGR